jgi:hypothetical protein
MWSFRLYAKQPSLLRKSILAHPNDADFRPTPNDQVMPRCATVGQRWRIGLERTKIADGS